MGNSHQNKTSSQIPNEPNNSVYFGLSWKISYTNDRNVCVCVLLFTKLIIVHLNPHLMVYIHHLVVAVYWKKKKQIFKGCSFIQNVDIWILNQHSKAQQLSRMSFFILFKPHTLHCFR